MIIHMYKLKKMISKSFKNIIINIIMANIMMEKFNNQLLEEQRTINIIDYVKEVNNLYYKIDISFIDEFINLVSKDECCIYHDKLQKYANYYLLLEECIKYFNDYQNKLKEKYIIIYKNRIDEQEKLLIVKDDKINNLEKKIDMIIENNNKLLEDNKNTKLINDKLLKYAEKSNNKLDEIYEELELTNEKLDTSDKTLNIVSKKLNIAVEDRVVSPKETNTIEYFIVMYNSNSEYQYYIIRGQKRYIKTKKDKLYGFEEIKQIVCVPNSTTLWNLMKEKLQNNIDYCGNKLNLINITQEDFINKIETIYNERKNIIV